MLLTRGGAQATPDIAEGAGDAAGAGGWSGGLAFSAAAAQATDQPKKAESRQQRILSIALSCSENRHSSFVLSAVFAQEGLS